MFLLDPTIALDLARYRLEEDMLRARNRRLAREARAARRATRRQLTPRGSRVQPLAPARAARPGFGH